MIKADRTSDRTLFSSLRKAAAVGTAAALLGTATVVRAQVPAATPATLVQTIDLRTWPGTALPVVVPPPPQPASGFALSGIAFDPSANALYVADYATTNVYIIDAVIASVIAAVYTNGIAPITADIGPAQNLPGTAPTTILANPVTNRWVFMGQGGGAQFTGTTLAEAVSARAFFSAGAWDPVTDNVYGADRIEFFAVNNLKFLYGGFPCAGGSNAVAVHPATSRVYVSCGNSQTGGQIVVFDGAALSQPSAKIPTAPLATVSIGAQASGVAVNPNTNRIYLAGATSATSLDVLDASTYQVVASIPGLDAPSPAFVAPGVPVSRPVAVNTVTNTIFVVNPSTSRISVFDGSSNAFVGTIATADGAVAVAVNESADLLYVANSAGTISVFAMNPTAVAPTFSISGKIRTAQGTPAAGVTVNAAGTAGAASAVTDATGLFVLTGLATGTYTVQPVSTSFSFAPNAQSVPVTASNVTGLVFTANPPIVPASYTLSPWTTIGPGVVTTATVTLNQPAPAAGAIIVLTASDPKAAKIPSSVTVPAGQSSVSFQVQGNSTASMSAVTLTAAYNGSAASTVLTVAPGDSVRVTSATYSRSQLLLQVKATGTNPSAVLMVQNANTNAILGSMVNLGGGNYSFGLTMPGSVPTSVNVVSNLGGKSGQGVSQVP